MSADSDFEIRLQRSFRTGLHLAEEVNFQELIFGKTAGWDSIAHLHLVSAIEKEFGILLTTRDMLDMSSYEAAVPLIKKYV